jgi:hypothetical protein
MLDKIKINILVLPMYVVGGSNMNWNVLDIGRDLINWSSLISSKWLGIDKRDLYECNISEKLCLRRHLGLVSTEKQVKFEQILKYPDNGVLWLELLGFWTLSIIWYKKNWKT